MKSKLLLAASITALMSTAPLAFAQNSAANASMNKGSSGTLGTGTTVSSTTATSGRVDAKPVEDLEAAAQRLRDAVHSMAKAPAGTQRNEAIKQANRTLLEVQNAIAALPPGVIAAAGNEGNYKQAMDRLEMAAQRLRDAAHALAREPVGAKRADAMKDINKALIDTQQVMLDVPMTSTTASAR
ncbi:MAG: hypothetical protein ACXWCY_07410 [Burkholderiales bacterium]